MEIVTSYLVTRASHGKVIEKTLPDRSCLEYRVVLSIVPLYGDKLGFLLRQITGIRDNLLLSFVRGGITDVRE